MQPDKVLHEFLSDLIGTGPEESAGDEAGNRCVPQESISTVREDSEPSEMVAGHLTDRAAASLPEPAGTEVPRAVREEGIPPLQQPFQILRIQLHDVELAVPLNDLDSIARWSTRATQLPGQPYWQPGIILHQGSQVRLVDLARVIMPERIDTDTALSGSYLLIVGGGRFGLICDRIKRPQSVKTEDVRWSGRHRYRAWAKGVLKEELSVLLDVGALLQEMGIEDA